MATVRESARDIPIVREVDVVVAGGGPAGFAAATAAARLGARVVLVERYGCLGGLATGGMVLYMDGLFNKAGERVMGGIPWEAMERLRAMNGLGLDAPTRIHVDSELLKVVADALCTEAGAELRFHSWVANTWVEDDTVQGVIVETKAGRQAIRAKVCIDATGDGDVAALAGATFETGRQRIGLNLKMGGIDRDRFLAFERDHPEQARALRARVREMGGFPLRPNTTPDSDAGVYWINILGLADRAGGGKDEGSVHDIFDGALDALSVEDLTFAEVTLRKGLVATIDLYRQSVPGFENAHLLAFASQLGVRDSRRITGLHKLSREDMLSQRRFDDAIGTSGLSFSNVGQYWIPYGSLVPERLDGLLLAGRCICADGWAQQAIRLIPPAMVTGQAAGTAAAMAARLGIAPRNLEPAALRRQLADDGVML
jgi:hypothetical protein